MNKCLFAILAASVAGALSVGSIYGQRLDNTKQTHKLMHTNTDKEVALKVGDAYVNSTAGRQQWTVGTAGVELSVLCSDGQPRLAGLKNKLVSPAIDYAVAPSAGPLFTLTTSLKEAPVWTIESGDAQEAVVGGRPAAQLNLTLKSRSLRVRLHFTAFPGTSIVRQWMEVEDIGSEAVVLNAPEQMRLSLHDDSQAPCTNYWMTGGTSKPDQGVLKQAPVGAAYQNSVAANRTEKFTPWMALLRPGSSGDGLFVSTDSLSDWSISAERADGGAVGLAVSLPSFANRQLAPGARAELPLLTFGVFVGGLDGMGKEVYDWQYQYLWDYTNPDYYARTQYSVPWFYCSRNLQEQFAARLGGLDMAGADQCRAVGFEMLWDDAGWAKYPKPSVPDAYANVFAPSYEGPDFSQKKRYLGKMGLHSIFWFMGRPSPGIMDAKINSWGDFQWRTDSVGAFKPDSEKVFRDNIRSFLDQHPKSSFHTCDGGSRYAHNFEIQRFADLNMLSDLGRGDEANYYFSYLDTPDKWMDVLEPYATPIQRYKPATSRQTLTMIPFWCNELDPADSEFLRRDIELYHYLLSEGVAGRWSYVFHPQVTGDKEHYYFQRTSHDLRKACIILRHQAPGEVVIYPHGLLPDEQYVVGFDSTAATTTRSGADLMEKGIAIKDQKPGELVFLNLPGRPGTTADGSIPSEPGNPSKHFESNLGHPGVGIYWSPGTDKRSVSYYEVRRGSKILGKTSIGNYYFDHAPGWDPAADYAVRTVNGGGKASPWKTASLVESEPLAFSALGGHFAEQGRDGWGAESTTAGDGGVKFHPMSFVRPIKNPAADIWSGGGGTPNQTEETWLRQEGHVYGGGGTPNQTGGAEGYWAAGGGEARVGRGWQQGWPAACCARVWTASQAGTVRVVGRVFKEYYRQKFGSPLHVYIANGDQRVWPADGTSAEIRPNDLVGASHDFTLEVKAGDKLRFVLEPGSEQPDNDIIAWMPKITYASNEAASKAPGTVVRLLCGSSADSTDSCGNVWSKDSFFKGGIPTVVKDEIAEALPTSKDMGLYQSGREGEDFTYAIPVKPGLYTLRLKFAETERQWFYERPINLVVNGQKALVDFDVCRAAHGKNRAFDKSFHSIVPDEQGFINLRLSGGAGPLRTASKAQLRAIEVVPELKPKIRIDCGADSEFIDWNSDIWSADTFAEGGHSIQSDAAVTQASPTVYDQRLYQTARSGKSFAYAIPVPPGLYTIQLKFAELWLKALGKRPMDIAINGQMVRKGWDPAQAAGELGMAAGIRVGDIAPDKDGKIVIRVSAAGAEDAILQAIEIE